MFPTAPVGTSVSLWNPLTLAYGATSVFDGAIWSSDLTLLPGTGARLTAPSGFTATFFGQPLNHDGSPLSDPIVLASPYSGPAGIFLLGDKCPVSASGDDIFLNVLGRTPVLGEQITLLDEATQTYTTSTSLGGGAWDIFPVWSVSDAAFFRVSVVPEPGIIILGLTGLGFLEFWRRWQKLHTVRK
jgi:hypothetical protein